MNVSITVMEEEIHSFLKPILHARERIGSRSNCLNCGKNAGTQYVRGWMDP
jgi:hypothetical protein